MSNLMQASKQWATRPADERFWTLGDMLAQCRYYRDSAAQSTVAYRTLHVQERDDQLAIVGPQGNVATMTHYAFGQLANRVGAPADYLRKLPAPIAAANLNAGLDVMEGEGNMLLHRNGGLVARCITSDKYSRIWNAEIVERMMPLADSGWRVPPARPAHADQPGCRKATEADVLEVRFGGGIPINVGDMIAPAGLYASDHDMFAFMVNENRRIDDGTEHGLSRGFFISNSEVGAAALKVTKFLYASVCGNHIVWDASAVSELRIVHRGSADHRFTRELRAELREYADASAAEDESRIHAAQHCMLGGSKEEVLDLLFGKKIAPRKTLEAAWDYAEEQADIHQCIQRSAWGFAQGMTRLSQDTEYAGERNRLDRAAGRVLQLAL